MAQLAHLANQSNWGQPGQPSREFWIEFLDLYRDNPCLWDHTSEAYSRKDLRIKAYNLLLAKYREVFKDATVHMMKRKIEVFRNNYRREEKKVIESRLIAKSSDEIYTPVLWYYTHMNFISSIERRRKPPPVSINEHVGHVYDDNPTAVSPMLSPTPKKRKTLYNNHKNTDNMEERKQQLLNGALSLISQIEEEDDSATFATNLKVQMRSLDTIQKYIAQKLISVVMFLARTNQLNYSSSVTGGSSDTSISNEALSHFTPEYNLIKDEYTDDIIDHEDPLEQEESDIEQDKQF